jgi:translation initiation factor 2 subunit 2
MFDSKLTKKKKKKKTGFDLDSAIAEGGNTVVETIENFRADKENMEVEFAVPEDQESLDLDNFGKKKRKKKKFNLEELDAALPETKKEVHMKICIFTNFTYSFSFISVNIKIIVLGIC